MLLFHRFSRWMRKRTSKDVWFGRTIVIPKRFSYEDAQEILEGKDGVFKDTNCWSWMNWRISWEDNVSRMAPSVWSAETKFQLDEKGKPIGVYVKERKDAHLLIEDFMLLANKAVATFIGREKKTRRARCRSCTAYTICRTRKSSSTFSCFAMKFGYKIQFDNPKRIARSWTDWCRRLKVHQEQAVLQQLAIRCMAKAVYTTNNIGHYGLGLISIRISPHRYAATRMWWCTVYWIRSYMGKTADAGRIGISVQAQQRAWACHNDAERASVKYKMAEFMLDRIGEHFEGVISGVKNWGIYVELPAYNCEGLVRVETMIEDNFVYDETQDAHDRQTSR